MKKYLMTQKFQERWIPWKNGTICVNDNVENTQP